MSDYKPTEHDGLRKDGQPDQRVGTGGEQIPTADPLKIISDIMAEFAQGKVNPAEAGKKGGQSSGGSGGDDSEESSGKGQFAGGKVDPVEAGRKGGNS